MRVALHDMPQFGHTIILLSELDESESLFQLS
jgi:hypothetical protein